MTWEGIFQFGVVALLAMVIIVFALGIYSAVRDVRHKHAVEMEMAKHGHRVEPGAVVVNTKDEARLAKAADEALRHQREMRGL
jgi:hypothetical protein